MLEILSDPNAWVALATLTVMEIVLGIDNIVFISVLVSRLPQKDADTARRLGLALALIFRIALLLIISWIIGLTAPVFTVWEQAFSWRDIILIAGGLFLMGKATHEIHSEVDADSHHDAGADAKSRPMSAIIAQLVVIDLVFSLDSIITAVGLADDLEVMVAAVVIAMIVMFIAANPVGEFIKNHPTTKMLALAFLLLIGVALVADGFQFHIPRGYIYFAMAFAGAVEFFNVLASRRRKAKH
jgi:predicted tellurium resistance membrane protein TerC